MLNTALVERQYPPAGGGDTVKEFSIDREKFHSVFAADLTEEQAADMAATQRPVSALGFVEPNGPPAWKTLPSWAVVSTGDTAAGADVVRQMAQRAGAVITEVEGSHVLFIARPQVVADVIRQALDTLSQGAAIPAPRPAGAPVRRRPGDERRPRRAAPCRRPTGSPPRCTAPRCSAVPPRSPGGRSCRCSPRSRWASSRAGTPIPGEEVGYIVAGTVEMRIRDAADADPARR